MVLNGPKRAKEGKKDLIKYEETVKIGQKLPDKTPQN